MKRFPQNKYFLATIAIVALVAYSFIVYAAAPTGGYVAGQTLNPNCAPGDTDCEVRQPWEMNTADGYVYNTAEKIGIGTDTPTHTH
jgi:hypothetical protein